MRLLLLLVFLSCGAYFAAVGCSFSPPSSFYSVDIRSSPGDVQLAVQAAVGILNRELPYIYSVTDDFDPFWTQQLLPNATNTSITPDDLMGETFEKYGAILYGTSNPNYTQFLPPVVTLAGLLDAIPISESLYAQFPTTKIKFDAREAWSTVEEAVQYAASIGLNQTSGLAIQNDTRLSHGQLADWIVSRRLFTTHLIQSCIPLTPDHELLKSIVEQAPWPHPVRVYGYNDLDLFLGGFLFEAETDCINVLGHIATATTSNLPFWQHIDPFDPKCPQGSPGGPLVQPPSPPMQYSPNMSYVALVYGDMDNVDFVRTFGSTHMQERVARCLAAQDTCFPLSWTLSPNLIEFMPATMRWYYDQAALTGGHDWFIMPPSGTLYSYPGEMPADVQAAYVEQQTQQAIIMNTSGSVHWEWIFTWQQAWNNYFPRYTTLNGTTTRAFFLNDVPWVFPIPGMWLKGETFRFVGDPSSPQAAVGFRPAFNWQESGSGGLPFNSTVIAGLINKFPAGSVQYIYVIQNTELASIFDMVSQLDSHIQLVSYEQLVDVARQAAMFGEVHDNSQS